MQKPLLRTSLLILTVTRAEQPVAFARVILDLKIIAHGVLLSVRLPPFAKDAFRSVRARDAPAQAPPSEGRGRMIGEKRDRFDMFGRIEQTRGARPMWWPTRATGGR